MIFNSTLKIIFLKNYYKSQSDKNRGLNKCMVTDNLLIKALWQLQNNKNGWKLFSSPNQNFINLFTASSSVLSFFTKQNRSTLSSFSLL